MIARNLGRKLKELAQYFPIVSLSGPRQSGKTTLIRASFSDYPYFSLETPSTLAFAKEDPKLFLTQHSSGVIIDEIQKLPELFSYLQQIVDEDKNAKFIISGSQNFLLLESVTQSLAGRVGLLNLLPFQLNEVEHLYDFTYFESFAFKGGYPPVYDRGIPPHLFYGSYLQTYVERDVRQILNVTNLNAFTQFLRICAGRVGQLINYSAIANDVGFSVNTVKQWLSILDASFITFRLQPYHKNYNKRLTKMPKLYFYDTGLLCHLLNIKDESQLRTHFAKGAIFENLVMLETMKQEVHQGNTPQLYFWRDDKGHEVDGVLERGNDTFSIECKSSTTISTDAFKGLRYWQKISELPVASSFVVYGGDTDQISQYGKLVGWKSWTQINSIDPSL